MIDEAVASARRYPAPNYVNQGNTATRYVSPRAGQSVVVNDKTGEVLHVGARTLPCGHACRCSR
jgi:hypothetical protein